MVFIGIDPGAKGAMAIITPERIEIVPFDEEKVRDKLDEIAEQYDTRNIAKEILSGSASRKISAFCAIEKVGAMPQQGVSSTFNFGRNFGFWIGLLKAYFIPYTFVTPSSWKREFMMLKTDKNQSVAAAHRLFPGVSLRASERCRVDSDGMAEALLIAEWGRRKYRE